MEKEGVDLCIKPFFRDTSFVNFKTKRKHFDLNKIKDLTLLLNGKGEV